MTPKERIPSREELDILAESLSDLFIQRQDLHARQRDDGRYTSIKRPLRRDDLLAHLWGDITLGAYVLDAESRARFMVIDADDEPDWRCLNGLARVLEDMGCASYLERSRRGGHLWLFFFEPIPGKDVRRFGRGLLAHFNLPDIELFPKQNRLSTGPGSLIRLPFGLHRKSGRRYGFYKVDGEPLAPTMREQILVLRAPETVPEAVFEQFSEVATGQKRKPAIEPQRARQDTFKTNGDKPLSTQIKEALSVRQFVLRYVELSPKGLGNCPFHDDNVASFNVNDEHNFWHCFACGTGGSVIDFWMQMQECDFTTAVRELREMLLVEEAMADELGEGETVVEMGEEPLAIS